MRRLKEGFLIALSAALLVLPYHWAGLWFLAGFAFIPYFFAVFGKTSSESFKAAYFFGFLFFAALGYWLTLVNVPGYLALVIYLALYFGIFGLLSASFLSPSGNFKNIVFIAAIWTALEYLRGWLFGGFPWALLSYSQWQNIYFIQAADIIGAYGVSFLVMIVNLLGFYWLKELTGKKRRIGVLSVFLMVGLLAPYLYGWLVLRNADRKGQSGLGTSRRFRVSVVQGNIPQDQKWNSRIKTIIFEKYKRLTFMAALEKADLIVWPETAFPGYLEDEPVMAAALRNMARQSKTDVLVGAPTMGNLEEGLKFFNSAILYGSSGEEKKRYSKMHLVPFGEYVPFEPLIGSLRNFVAIGHFSPGNEQTIFVSESRAGKIPVKARFGVLICYEDIFPGFVRGFSSQGVDFLVNITNDAWFGKSSAPYQHAAASVFRAVENRVPVIRAANTGLSCFISPEGRVLASVEDKGSEIFVTGQKTYELVLKKSSSFYMRFGDLFMPLTFLLCYWAYRERKKQAGYSQI